MLPQSLKSQLTLEIKGISKHIVNCVGFQLGSRHRFCPLSCVDKELSSTRRHPCSEHCFDPKSQETKSGGSVLPFCFLFPNLARVRKCRDKVSDKDCFNKLAKATPFLLGAFLSLCLFFFLILYATWQASLSPQGPIRLCNT